MRTSPLLAAAALACGLASLPEPAQALTSVQVGASGKTYASAAVLCSAHPTLGMAPGVQAGLYNPTRKNSSATVALNGTDVATVTLISPDAQVWLNNGIDTVTVSINRKTSDSYVFDASLAWAGQPNLCIPDTRLNTLSGDVEYAQSLKSYASVPPGCAFNAATGRAQPYVNLFSNGVYLLNVSVNNVPLTQLDGRTRTRAVVFLGAGLNVIAAANMALSTDHYVRDGGSGSCTLP